MSYNDAPLARKDLIRISGAVEEVIYRNDENGYSVAVIDYDNEPVTVTGIMPNLRLGNDVNLMGEWVNHPQYGRQFKVHLFEVAVPDNADGMLKYLSSRAVKGIGPKTAKRIVDQFGASSFDVIENDPKLLATVRGISEEKAQQISLHFREQFGVRNIMMFFGEHFGPTTSMKIYKRFGNAAVDIIKTNPYLLCEEIYGIGFERADRLAMALGVPADAPSRVESGILYLLNYNAAANGHVYLPEPKLKEAAAALLSCPMEAIERAMNSLCNVNRLVKRNLPRHVAVYTKRAYEAERNSARKLDLLAATDLYGSIEGADGLIEETQMLEGITYEPLQKKAIISAINHSLTVITGGPGTGKTTIIRAILRIFLGLGLKVALAAPTGRAAKRMSETTGSEAKTIHRLLEMEFSETEEPRFFRSDANPLEQDVVIVDELSMMDIFLFSSLLAALRPGTRLVLIGDADQLPSVGAGDVLRDIIASQKYPVCRLDRIFRQAGESNIVLNAHRINNGEYPQRSDKNGDFFLLERPSAEAAVQTVLELCQKRLPNTYGEKILEGLQILSCTRKGPLGTYNLNALLQNALNPPSPYKKQHVFREVIFRQGDKVMQITNNYDLIWCLETDPSVSGTGVFNGDIGTVLAVNEEEEFLQVSFDGRLAEYDFSQLDELEHAWAVTVHKSQGSEYPVVILPVFDPPPMLATRNLLYTAITRAKEMVIIVGKNASVCHMVDNNRMAGRYTALAEP